MLKLPSTDINPLLDRVLAKHSWTQERLSQEMNVGPHTISRWRSGGGIHKAHHEELLRLDMDEKTVPVKRFDTGFEMPFEVTIPRASLKFSLDKNGDINIKGMLRAMINKEE